MEIKKRLGQYSWINKNIELLEDRLVEIDTKLTKVTPYTQEERDRGVKAKDTATLIDEKIEVQEMINRNIEKGLREIKFIENTIEGLEEREKLLMRLRYIEDLKWEEVCVKMNYEWRHIHNIHSKALKKLDKEVHTSAQLKML